jgi:hypothetical protein
VQWERGNGGLGGDFDYGRWIADLRHYHRTSPGQQLNWRVVFATTYTGEPPIQKAYGIGGIGTLRAHSYKEFVGTEVLLANLEYRIDLGRYVQMLMFADSGATANLDESVLDKRFALDGGVGVGFYEDRASVYVARNLQDADGKFKFGFRLASTF